MSTRRWRTSKIEPALVPAGRRLVKFSTPFGLAALLALAPGAVAHTSTPPRLVNSQRPPTPMSVPAAVASLTAESGRNSMLKCFTGPSIASCYTMTLSVTGDQKLHGTTQISEQYSCSQLLLKTASGGTELPLPAMSLDNGNVSFSANIEGWRGLGAYHLQSPHNNTSFVSVGGGGGVTVGRLNYSWPVPGATKPARATAIVRANAAVSVTFSNLAAVGHPSRTVSGVAQYSCKNV